MEQKENSILLLFTSSYPYGDVAESFLDPEIPYISATFDKVILIPLLYSNSVERVERKLPENVEIDDSLLKEQASLNKGVLNKISLISNAITSMDFYREIVNKPEMLFHVSTIKTSIGFFGRAVSIKKWIERYIEFQKIDLSKTVFYTYWLFLATSGLSMAKKNYPTMKIVTRAHSGDLYSEMNYIPNRPEVLKCLNRLYLISEHGKRYILAKYPSLENVCKVSRLGTKDMGFLTAPSSDNIFRIVSCSYIVPVKRVDLLIQSLELLGKTKSSQKYEWTHIGYGPLKLELDDIANTILPENVTHKFVGYLPKEEMISFYKNNCIDVFINVSASEGIPVSIMEAQSCGIPVIATEVGGTPEIVSNDVGLLLSKNPGPKEIMEALSKMMENPDKMMMKRKKSRDNWENNYNSRKNFEIFSHDLKKI